MKQLLITLLAGTCLLSQFSSLAQADKTKMKAGNLKVKTKVGAASMAADMMLPYTANYSSKFRMGDARHANMILSLWKDYDDNDFERHADWFADTVTMILPSGDVIKGKEAALKGVKQYRSSITSVKSMVDAWIPLYSIDRNENWVAIWGTEEDTDASGKMTSTELQEIWRINKDGKVDFMKQFSGKTPPRQ